MEHVLTNRETSYISEDSDTALVVLGTAPGLLYPQRLKVVVRVDDEEWVITVANRDDEE